VCGACSQGSPLPNEGEQARRIPQGGEEVRKGVQAEEQEALQAVTPHLIASTFLAAAVINSGYLPLYPVAIGYWLASMGNELKK
jgi:hypothetical protein